MPKYVVELDGHQYEIEGPSPPTEDDVRSALGGQKPEEPPGALETAGREAALGVTPGVAAGAAFAPGFAAGAPFAPETYGIAPFVTGGVASLLAGGAVEFGQQKLLEKFAPGFLQKTAAGAQAHPLAAGVGRVASALPAFELAPGQAIRGAIAVPKILSGTAQAAEKRAAAGLAAQVGTQAGITAAQTGLVEHRLPTAKELLESAAIAGLYGHPRGYLSLPLPQRLQTNLKEYYAAQKRKLEESRQQQYPRTETQRVSPETGGGYRPAPAAGLEKEAQVSLDPNVPDISGSTATGFTLRLRGKVESGFKTHDEAAAAGVAVLGGQREMGGEVEAPPEDDLVTRMEREAIDQGEAQGVKFSVQQDAPQPEDPNIPWAQHFFQAQGEGKANLYRTNFAKWVIEDLRGRGLTEGQIKEAIRSRVGEEKFHNDVMGVASDEEVAQYARDLTAAEKAIERRIYGAPLKDDLQVGHEAIRRRLQQAHMMTPSEFAETVGREHWTIKGLDYLGRIIRKSREALGTQAAARQAELYNRALRNIDYAKAVLTGTQFQGPGASRRHDPRRPAPEMSREMEEKLIDNMERRSRLGPSPREASESMGYEPNIYTALDWYASHPDSDWGLNNRDRAALLRWFKSGEDMGWGRAAMLEAHLRSAEWWAKHLVAVSEGREKREYYDPPMANIADHAQSAIDDLDKQRRLLESLTGSRYPKFETPSYAEEKRFDVKWQREQIARLERDIADMEELQRRYQDKLPNLSARELKDFQSLQDRIPNWKRTLEDYKSELSQSEERSLEEGISEELDKPIVERPPPPPDHPELPFASRREEPEKLTAAAFVTPEGTVETGPHHPGILDRLGIKGFEKAESRNTPDFGFSTTHRPFVTREEAGPIAERSGQALKEFEPGEPVHSDEVAAPGTRTPISEGPAASRRYRKTAAELAAEEREREQGQAGMFAKVPTSQIPPTPPEQRQVPTDRPVGQLENAASYIFAGFNPPIEARTPGEGPPIGAATEPTFQNFLKWARNNISQTIQSGPLFDVWLDTVNKTIENASGAKLNDMVEKLDVKHRVYPWKKKYSGAPRDYTRVEIPDFQPIPADPNRLPMAMENAIRQRVLESEMFPEDATEEDIAKAQDKAVEAARKEVMALVPEERRKDLADARERIIKGQKLRSKALSAIYQRVIEEGMPTITDLTPKDITTEDIAFDNPNTKFGAYRTISPEERANESKLRAIFADEARVKGAPVSHTRRLAVMLNRRSGEVALVSAYPHGRSGVLIVEPSGATGKRGKPNVPIKSAMNRGWEPIIAVLRGDPVKDFYKGFKDIADYNRYLGTEASQLESSSTEEFIGARPEDELSDVPEWTNQDWKQQAYATEPTEHDLTRINEERERPTEEFVGPMPSEVVGEEFRPGSAVERGEGGSLIGPEAGIARMGRGERWQSTPLSTREALAVHNWLNDPEEWAGTTGVVPDVEKATTKPEMREALQRLYDLASNNKLKPRQWNAIVALRKMALEQFRRDRNEFADFLREERAAMKSLTKEERQAQMQRLYGMAPTPEGAMVTALDRLYEINQISESQADYLSHAMGEFARPIPEAKTATPVQGAPTGARELTVPRFARREVPAESLPADLGRRTEPAPELLDPQAQQFVAQQAAQEFKYEPTVVLRSLPVTPTKVGGNKFIGDVPLSSLGPPKLMPHEFRDEPLIYPSKGIDFEAQRHRTLVEAFGNMRRWERQGPAASIREIKETAAREWLGIRTFVNKLFTEPAFREQTAEELGSAAQQLGPAKFRRAETEHDIMASRDGADRQVELYAERGSNNIRAASVQESDTKKPTFTERLLGTVINRPFAKQVRESALAIQAALHFANTREWKRITDAWTEAKRIVGQEEARAAGRPIPGVPERLRPVYKKPEWVEIQDLDSAIELAQRGLAKADAWINGMDSEQRRIGRRWKQSVQRLVANAQWAKEHFNDPELKKTWDVYKAVQDQHLADMNRYGLTVRGRDFYVPGRYEGIHWNDDAFTFGEMRVIGRNFRMPKTYPSYYHAISDGPYIPITYDIANLAQHSLASGGRIMARDTWLDALARRQDPQSGEPVALQPTPTFLKPVEMSQSAFDEWTQQVRQNLKPGQAIPPEILNQLLREAGVARSPVQWQVPKGKLDYELVWPAGGNSKPMAVRKGYSQLVKIAMAQSAVRDMKVLGRALTVGQMLKHSLVLILDSFHPGRLLQYMTALGGKSPWGVEKPTLGGNGIAALSWSPESYSDAVRIGAITQKQADWANAPVKLWDKSVSHTVPRHEALRMMAARGLNATQTADALYRNSIQRIPFIGRGWNTLLSPFNRAIFDRITPGLIAESAVGNLERISGKNKKLSIDQQVREVVRDMNVFYGNLGRNGVFANPTSRDLAQIPLLAAMWQEGLVAKELKAVSRLTGLSWVLGRRGLGADVYFGPLVRGMVRGLGAYFVLTQAINLVTRGKFTFQNEEEGHKMDAWLPLGGEPGIWLSPMSVFGEVIHDLVRLAETKPKTWDAVTQIGRNKLGPIGRLALILVEGKSPTGETISTTGGVLGRAAQELAPAPISVGTYARAAGHAIAPNLVSPTRPGQVAQRALSAVGIKTQTGTRVETDVRRLAAAFVKNNNLSYEPLAFTPTDQASYAKLRGALRNDDVSGAAQVLKELRRHRSNEQILKAMKLESQRPFAGSKANENLFLYSLSNAQLEAYFKANLERAQDYNKFLQFYINEPLQ